MTRPSTRALAGTLVLLAAACHRDLDMGSEDGALLSKGPGILTRDRLAYLARPSDRVVAYVNLDLVRATGVIQALTANLPEAAALGFEQLRARLGCNLMDDLQHVLVSSPTVDVAATAELGNPARVALILGCAIDPAVIRTGTPAEGLSDNLSKIDIPIELIVGVGLPSSVRAALSSYLRDGGATDAVALGEEADLLVLDLGNGHIAWFYLWSGGVILAASGPSTWSPEEVVRRAVGHVRGLAADRAWPLSGAYARVGKEALMLDAALRLDGDYFEAVAQWAEARPKRQILPDPDDGEPRLLGETWKDTDANRQELIGGPDRFERLARGIGTQWADGYRRLEARIRVDDVRAMVSRLAREMGSP